jgi:phosphoribosyl 1,2-cyclic phosphate phosphodiesterase
MEFMKYKKIEIESYEPIELFDMKITLFDVNHPPLRKSHGIKIENDGFRVVVSGDTNRDVPQKSISEIENTDLFIVEALAPETYRFRKHMNSSEALSLARQINARKVVLTHLGHFFPPHTVAVKKYPVGRDLQCFSFGQDAELNEFF